MITLDNLTKTFVQKDGKPVTAVNAVSLEVPPGEICVFLGPSGWQDDHPQDDQPAHQADIRAHSA